MTEIKVGSKWRMINDDRNAGAEVLHVDTVDGLMYIMYVRESGTERTVKCCTRLLFKSIYEPVSTFFKVSKLYRCKDTKVGTYWIDEIRTLDNPIEEDSRESAVARYIERSTLKTRWVILSYSDFDVMEEIK